MIARPKYTKKDKNHAEIVSQCKELGMVVWDTADLGGEILDIIIMWKGKIAIVEIKSPGGRLTKNEKISINKLKDVGIDVIVAYGLEDILKYYEN